MKGFKMKNQLSISYNISTLGMKLDRLFMIFADLARQKETVDEVNVILQNDDETIYFLVKNELSKYKFFSNIFLCEYTGLSLSRNIGLNLATSDLVVLCDDDCRYPNDSSLLIKKGFRENPCWEIISFCIKNDRKLFRCYNKTAFQHNIRTVMSVSSIEIVINKKHFLHLKLFDEKIGLGTPYITGAENIMLVDALNLGKKIGFAPYVVVDHSRNTSAHNIDNLNHLLVSKGVMFAKMFGFLGIFFCVLFWFRRLYSDDKKLKLNFSHIFLILKGYCYCLFNKDRYFK